MCDALASANSWIRGKSFVLHLFEASKDSCRRELRYRQVAESHLDHKSFCSLMLFWKIGLLVDEQIHLT